MKKIDLQDFTLESFDYDNKEHVSMINRFDMDSEINKYIIPKDESFSDVVDAYRYFKTDEIYNNSSMLILN